MFNELKKVMLKVLQKVYLSLDGADNCAGSTFQGRKQAHGIVVKLYNSDRNNVKVEQKNALIFPLELSRDQYCKTLLT